jgi:quinol monooxygenase YgiN
MIIIAGWLRTAEGEDRDAAVAAFAKMVGRARERDGCLDLAIGADALDPERINLFECWRDGTALAAWRKAARGPKVRTRETEVKLYHCEKAEPPC